MSQPPLVLALVLCDGLVVDPSTKKPTLVGCFSQLSSPSFPCVHPSMGVYAAVTEAHDTREISFVLVDVDEARDPVRVSPPLRVSELVVRPDPKLVIEAAITATEIDLPAPGEYRLQLLADGDLLVERRLMVLKAKAGGN